MARWLLRGSGGSTAARCHSLSGPVRPGQAGQMGCCAGSLLSGFDSSQHLQASHSQVTDALIQLALVPWLLIIEGTLTMLVSVCLSVCLSVCCCRVWWGGSADVRLQPT
jgi:hypothetical protein